MSIEIFNGAYAASLWADAHNDALVESAVTAGAIDWDLKRTAWGIVFEVEFKTEAEWELYKQSDAFRNAITTAPDAETGVLIYRGRSLDSGNFNPRKPKDKSGSGANALTIPFEPKWLHQDSGLDGVFPSIFNKPLVGTRNFFG